MSASENSILSFFKECGFDVEKIPESNEKSPDFLLFDGSHRILLELKEKFDPIDVKQKRAICFENGKSSEELDVVKRTTRNSNIIKEATKQLRAQKEKYNADFCLIVFKATGPKGEIKRDQFKSSLYGAVEIVNLGDNYVPPKQCYFYENSDFFNQRDILDGSFIFSETEGQLCLNPLSSNYESFKVSSLPKLFHKGVVDPFELERQSFAYMITADIDRKNKTKLQYYLSDKYALDRLVSFKYPQLTTIFSVEVEK